jgi:magnesium-transporting ATPase (P-type)
MEKQALSQTAWHTISEQAAIYELQTVVDRGLSADEVERRLEHYGRNRIASGEIEPWWLILVRQFLDPLIYILLISAAVMFLLRDPVDGTVILLVVVINAAIGFCQELRARKAIRALSKLSAPKARVRRDGRLIEVPSEELVPGDIVELSAGSRVPADLRLIQTRKLEIDESALTGESSAVVKQVEVVADEHAVPGDQLNLAFSGTTVTRGSGKGLAVRTGGLSELGRIAQETQQMDESQAPIKEKMHRLGRMIGAAVLLLAGIIIFGGLAAGLSFGEVVRTAVALAVGAVPEALPVVLTVTLSVAVQRMAKRQAIVRALPAVETLGSTTVVGSDKTGTLTANQMTVKAIWTAGRFFEVTGSGYNFAGEIRSNGSKLTESDDLPVRQTLLAGLVAGETEELPGENSSKADPTELALLVSAVKGGFDIAATREAYRQIDIIPFESERQFMATLNQTPNGRGVFLKGSPEAVLERCRYQLGPSGEEIPLDYEAARRAAAGLADRGHRVLGMAFRAGENEQFQDHDPGGEFVLAGLQGMQDPIRPEVKEAVKKTAEAGIRVLMLTGDHLRTARSIGRELGLCNGKGDSAEGRNLEGLSDQELDRIIDKTTVYARVSPEHKLRIVERLKTRGHIVAVTGDGINDAPALQSAHLGIAMGKTGTDVAREASDMVLADDNFASITAAVEEGRVVFSNIRKVTYFLLSTGVGLVAAILAAFFGPWPLPFQPVQVLWINLVTKGLQDVSLAFEPGEPGLLREPPRDPREQVLHRPILLRMFVLGAFMAAGTLAVFWWFLQDGASPELARSAAMTQMVMFQFFHVFNCRSLHRSIFTVPLLSNPYVVLSVTLALAAHIAVLQLPWLRLVFETEPLSLSSWIIITLLSLSIVVVAELDKALLLRRKVRPEEDAGG